MAADAELRSSVEAALRRGETVPVEVATPMPIRVVSQTAWVADDGVVQFRNDIYDGTEAVPGLDVVARARD